MELTINQALQTGITAHKEGKLQEAEKLYRLIIQSEPNHPDANHNLGVLAVGLEKFKQAIPYFKIAIEASPHREQYWLSCIDALIKLNQLDRARDILKQGKALGLGGYEINQLEVQLNLKSMASSPTTSLKE